MAAVSALPKKGGRRHPGVSPSNLSFCSRNKSLRPFTPESRVFPPGSCAIPPEFILPKNTTFQCSRLLKLDSARRQIFCPTPPSGILVWKGKFTAREKAQVSTRNQFEIRVYYGVYLGDLKSASTNEVNLIVPRCSKLQIFCRHFQGAGHAATVIIGSRSLGFHLQYFIDNALSLCMLIPHSDSVQKVIKFSIYYRCVG